MKLHKPSATLVLAGALVALVPLLAALQYRWVGQVSRAERDRMRASLDAAVKNFCEDLDRELTRAYLDLQIDAPQHGSESPLSSAWRAEGIRKYGQRYHRWLAQAPHPRLIKDIYLIEAGPRVSHFDSASSKFDAADWPAEMASYRSSIEQALATPESGWPLHPPGINAVLEEVPALVIPIPNIKFITDKLRLRVMAPDLSIPGFVVAILDRDLILHELLPEMASRYFATGGRFDYNVLVVRSADPESVVYYSEDQSAHHGRADATANLFRIRVELQGLLDGAASEIVSTREEAQDHATIQSKIALQYVNRETSAKALGPTARSDRIFNARIALLGASSGYWQVRVTHKAGSLDAAVTSARNRNLIVSFGVLLLLSIGVGLIVVSTRRASRLARQQIEFVAGVSHELRTPLAVIRSAAENLADGVVEDRQQVRQYGRLIEKEGRRLGEMIEQTLEFAGIQSGRRNYSMQPLWIDRVISDAIAASRALLEENHFAIETQVEPGLPLVPADGAALSRAIQNLISNAVKYSADERWLRIEARSDFVIGQTADADERKEKAVLISVEDRGVGINTEESRRVFEPFYRGRSAVSAQIHGNGLGLSLVRHIVEAHGGEVTVESRPGRGSRFTLRLPVPAETPAEVART